MGERRDEYLWSWQWEQLEAIVLQQGVRPNSFKRVETLKRPSWFGERWLSKREQSAELRHHAHDDVWIRVQHRAESYDEYDNAAGDLIWVITMSPQPSGRPRTYGYETFQADDWEDLLDLANEWAAVAVRELRVRDRVEAAQTRAEKEWARHVGPDRPREITRLSSFVDEELPRLVEDGLRQAGVSSDGDLDRGVAAVRRKTEHIVEQAADADPRTFPELFGEVLRQAFAEEFAERIARTAFSVAIAGVNAFWGLVTD